MLLVGAFDTAGLELPHDGAASTFSVAIVPPPEHKLTVKVIEKDTAAPIEDALVRLGAYRAKPAAPASPKSAAQGPLRAQFWKAGYEIQPKTLDLDQDVSLQLEALVVPEEDPDALGRCDGRFGPCAGRRGGSHLRHASSAMTSVPAIAVDRLVKVYKTVTAVDGISFALEAGSCTALLGGNGAGKTTTIATIMGLVQPTSGRVTVLGAEMPRQRHLVLHRMNFESPYVDMPMRLTVRQNLNVFGMLYGVRGRRRRASRRWPLSSI